MHSDQWRYDHAFSEMCPVTDNSNALAHGHTADKQALAVRCGWLPCFPQFTEHNFELVHDAEARGIDPVQHVVDRSGYLDRLRDVVQDEVEVAASEQVLDVLRLAGDQIVDRDDRHPLGEETFAQMRSEEAGAAGDQSPLHAPVPTPVEGRPTE